MRAERLFFSFTLTCAALMSAHAEPKWVQIGNKDFYYDKNSFSTNGDLVFFSVLIKGSEQGSGSGSMTIDCKNRVLFSENRKIATSSHPELDELANSACKPWWRFWR